MKYLLVTAAAIGAFAAAPAFAASSSDGMAMTCEEFTAMDSDAQMEALNMGAPADQMEGDTTGGADPGTMPDATGGGGEDSGDMTGSTGVETSPTAADVVSACAENPEMTVEEAVHGSMEQ
ncbi:hypothetical protein [Inquilinus sp. CAU 1745]|uniref:hypothetical protein n=1 Tax=Inquilinus sp. CAU 1745 TaxID=3140369 RepID=UPI00325ACFB4